MKELIKITEKDGEQLISARELHEVLEVKNHFSQWANDNLKMFDEGVEYQSFKVEVNAGHTKSKRMDYVLKIDTAKEMAMMSKVPKGKEVRQYFIAVEKKARQEILNPKSTLDILELTIKELRDQKTEIDGLKAEVRQIKATQTTLPEYYTVIGYANINDLQLNLRMSGSIGKKASKMCRDRGIEMGSVPDPRFGKINTYPLNILEEVFETNIN